MILSNPRPILGFDDRLFAVIGIVLNTHTVMAIYYTGAFFKVPFSTYISRWSGEVLAVSALWVVIRWLYFLLIKKYPGLKNQKKRFLIIPFFLVPYFIISILYIYLIQPYFDWHLAEFPEPQIETRIVTGIIIFFVDIAFYEGLHLFVELKDTRLREERLKKENVTSQLHNLKNQVSPHFLFNSLNTLLYLIDEDKEKSKLFVHRLSKIYARILKFSDKDLVPLKEELDYINEYMKLLKKRHGDNLTYKLEVSAGIMHKMIVPLSLQAGIENAVKHNIISKKNPLTIIIKNLDNYIVINNNLQRKKGKNEEGGKGLENIKNRYKLLSKKEMIIQETQTQFNLMLPLLEPMN